MWWEGRIWDSEKLFHKKSWISMEVVWSPWLAVGCVGAAPPEPEWCQGSPVCGANVPAVLGLPGREAGPVPGKLTSSTWIFFASNPNSEKTD